MIAKNGVNIMSAISLEVARISTSDAYEIHQKPLSLKVYETAIPVLKTLSLVLELTADIAFCFALDAAITANPVLLIVSIVVSAVSTILLFTVDYLERRMSRRLERLDNPDWIKYFSNAYRNRPLENLIAALPNRNCWKKLDWNGLDWKRKIVPYAESKGMDRKTLRNKFPSVFDLVNPYLYHYYRKTELPILQAQGFHAYLAKAGTLSPLSIEESEFKEQLRKETKDLSAAQIEEQYPPQFIKKYLNENLCRSSK